MSGITFPVIGTTAHLLVTDRSALASANRLLRDFLADLDRACSRFRPDSALSTVNRQGSASDVDPLLVAALRVALAAAHDTDGLVDPTLGTAMIAIGYDRSFAGVARTSGRRVTPVPGREAWREITIDEPTGTVTLPRGVRLDLGATAKAWAADVAATQIAERLGCGAVVNLGGDLAIAGTAPAGGWRVRVTADHAATTGGQVVTVRSGGLATSSTTVRRWKRADQVLHHVLDPATGLPARRVWQYVSVAAADCVTANTAATAALVLGERAPDWLAARDLAARLVAWPSPPPPPCGRQGGGPTPTHGSVTRIAGWPTEIAASTVEIAS